MKALVLVAALALALPTTSAIGNCSPGSETFDLLYSSATDTKFNLLQNKMTSVKASNKFNFSRTEASIRKNRFQRSQFGVSLLPSNPDRDHLFSNAVSTD